jgi:hypothetical protein
MQAVFDFIRALPPEKIIGVEVPLKNLADAGVPVEERVHRALPAPGTYWSKLMQFEPYKIEIPRAAVAAAVLREFFGAPCRDGKQGDAA